MTASVIRAALIAAGVLALQACNIPQSQYAPYEGYQTPTPHDAPKPQYPVRADEPAPQSSPAAEVDPHGPTASPSKGVTGESLPPAAAPPPGPTSENQPVFLYASTEPVFIRVASRRVERHGRRHVSRTAARLRGSGGAGEVAAGGVLTVKVKKGDTINDLADRYGTTRQAILRANHIRHPADLAVGSTLRIPTPKLASSKTAAAAAGRSAPATYRLKRGDTIYAIGRKYGIPPKEILALNGWTLSVRLHPGQIVKLPGGPTEAAGASAPKTTRVERAGLRSRSHETFEASNGGAAPSTHVADASPLSLRPAETTAPPARQGPTSTTSTISGPSQPIPYASLPGHIVAPPARTVITPIAPAPAAEPQAPPPPPDAQIVLAGRGRFTWPVRGPVLSGFGLKPGGQRNDGLDISAPDGAPVRAAASGDVVYAGNQVPGFGNLVLIKHEDGWVTAYAHLSRTEVKIRDHVTQGSEIGQVGVSGGATQPEVHFEIRYAPTPRDKARPVDPTLLLSNP